MEIPYQNCHFSFQAPFENPFGTNVTPKNEENWANFGNTSNKDEEMSPVKTAGRFEVSGVEDVSTPPRSPVPKTPFSIENA